MGCSEPKNAQKSPWTKPWNQKIEKTVGPFKLTTIELIHLTYPEQILMYTIKIMDALSLHPLNNR